MARGADHFRCLKDIVYRATLVAYEAEQVQLALWSFRTIWVIRNPNLGFLSHANPMKPNAV